MIIVTIVLFFVGLGVGYILGLGHGMDFVHKRYHFGDGTKNKSATKPEKKIHMETISTINGVIIEKK